MCVWYECICTQIFLQVFLAPEAKCWLPGCLHLFRICKHCCSDCAQCYLLLLHGHPECACAWRTSARHCTCSLQAFLLRLWALHPSRAVIMENRHLGVGEGSGCCTVRRQCQPTDETRAEERWWGAMVAGSAEVPSSLLLQKNSGQQHCTIPGQEKEGEKDEIWENTSFLI